MALIDVNESADLNQLEKDLTAAIGNEGTGDNQAGSATPTETPAQPSTERPGWIDEKFWTGDVEASAQKQHEAYLSLQSAHGRMANDLGEQRKLTDRILQLEEGRQAKEQPAPAPEIEVTGSDLLNNPKDVLDRYFEQRAASVEEATSARLNQLESELVRERFMARHPDFNEVANSPDFVTWVNGTQYRMGLAQSAQHGDYQAADALLEEFKAARGTATADTANAGTQAAASSTDLTEEARKASLESTASGGDAASGKIYSRAALMELRLKKPQMYQDPAFQEEIRRAYAEDRVK